MSRSTRATLTAGAATALGALPLAGGFAQQRWFWYALGAVAVVAGVGLLLRWGRVPAPFIVPVQLIGLLIFHTAVFAADQGYAGVLPSGASLHALNQALSDGLHDIQYLAAPVPARTDIVVLTALAVGLLAIVVDIVAVSLARPAVAGLALLALFAVATAVSARTLFFEFVGAGAGYLLLLADEGRDRLLRWGRVVSADDLTGAETPGATAVRPPRHSAAARVGVAAMAVALLLPALLPGFSRNVLSSVGHNSAGRDGGQQSFGSGLSPFTQLRGALEDNHDFDVLKVTANQAPWYLRVTVLDDYTADGWQRSNTPGALRDLRTGLALPEQLDRLRTARQVRNIDATVEVTGYRDDRLPVYYAPTSVTGAGAQWRYDTDRGEVAGRHTATRSGQKYHITAVEPEPTRTQLDRAHRLAPSDPIMAAWGKKPAVTPKVLDVTRGIIADADGPWARADAINNYFTDGIQGFQYSLRTKPGSSTDALQNFLETKQGYCEQYASAMAVMLRLAEIPSRVVLGYAQGSYDGKSKTWTITSHDAHAWVEAYFDGVGWVDFDPTPRDDGHTAQPAWQTQSTGQTEPTLPSAGSSAPRSSSGPDRSSSAATNSLAGGGGSSAGSGGGGAVSPWVLGGSVVAALIVLALLTPGLVRLRRRRRSLVQAGGRDPTAAAHAAWAELRALLADLAVAVRPAESPRAAAARVAADRQLDPVATSALSVVALAEERARYAPRAGVPADLPTALRAARHGLLGGASRLQRARIAIAPPSVLQALATGAVNGRERLAGSIVALQRSTRRLRRQSPTGRA